MDDNTKKIGDCLIELAELLTTDCCEITANELLENITCRSICEEKSHKIDRYLSS